MIYEFHCEHLGKTRPATFSMDGEVDAANVAEARDAVLLKLAAHPGRWRIDLRRGERSLKPVERYVLHNGESIIPFDKTCDGRAAGRIVEMIEEHGTLSVTEIADHLKRSSGYVRKVVDACDQLAWSFRATRYVGLWNVQLHEGVER